MTIKEKIEKYIALGYTERHDFPDEYTLLVNRKTMDMVRIYLDGRIRERRFGCPEYVLIKE